MELYLSQEIIRPRGVDVAFLRELPRLPVRQAQGHKGTYGLSLVVGGSRGMSGAVALAGCGALVAGSGLVRLIVPEAVGDLVALLEKEYMTVYAPDDRAGQLGSEASELIELHAKTAAAVAIGPGLGRSDSLNLLVKRLFWSVEKPMVVDADALNALACMNDDSVSESRGVEGPRILTPHPGEMSRLTGKRIPDDLHGRKEAALDLTRRFCRTRLDFRRHGDFVLVLKGHETVITDGELCFVNRTGNAGLATGGSGDVLTGIVTALLAQGMQPMDAARLGVGLHGLAADCAACFLPLESIIASTIVQFFPVALRLLRCVQEEQ